MSVIKLSKPLCFVFEQCTWLYTDDVKYVCDKLILAHMYYTFGFVSKIGCDRSGTRAMLTVGRMPSLEWSH